MAELKGAGIVPGHEVEVRPSAGSAWRCRWPSRVRVRGGAPGGARRAGPAPLTRPTADRSARPGRRPAGHGRGPAALETVPGHARRKPSDGSGTRPSSRRTPVKLLVTGGAGYVGSVCAAHLVEHGHEVTVLDNLLTGHQDAVPDGARFVQGDLAEAADELLAEGFDGVLHFAARSLVGESVQRPELYWQGNVVTTLRLLEAMRDHGTPRLVFSSTAATYGEPEQVPITEDAPTRPTNPYGASKLAIDNAITSYATAHGLAAVSLRYFNVAGAHGRFGERHAVETHLIPIVLQVAPASGSRCRCSATTGRPRTAPASGTTSTSTTWPRRTCWPCGTRARAGTPCTTWAGHRLLGARGAGGGRAVTGHPIPAVAAPRRDGDPAVLIASSEAAQAELGWRPQRTDLATMVGDAWRFAQSRAACLTPRRARTASRPQRAASRGRRGPAAAVGAAAAGSAGDQARPARRGPARRWPAPRRRAAAPPPPAGRPARPPPDRAAPGPARPTAAPPRGRRSQVAQQRAVPDPGVAQRAGQVQHGRSSSSRPPSAARRGPRPPRPGRPRDRSGSPVAGRRAGGPSAAAPGGGSGPGRPVRPSVPTRPGRAR